MSRSKQPSISYLNKMLPGTAYKMEKILLLKQLQQLNIDFCVKHFDNKITISIPTIQNIPLVFAGPELTPASNNCFFTMVFTPTYRSNDGVIHASGIQETVKVTLEISDLASSHFFTCIIHEKSLEKTLAVAIDSYNKYRGIKLQPKIKKRIAHNKQSEKEDNEQ
jgi:hypothetical protein